MYVLQNLVKMEFKFLNLPLGDSYSFVSLPCKKWKSPVISFCFPLENRKKINGKTSPCNGSVCELNFGLWELMK